MRTIEPIIGALGVAATGAWQVAMQTTPIVNDSIVDRLIREGGAYLVLAVVFYFYRKDWATLVSRKQEEIADLRAALHDATESAKATAVALGQHTEVLRSVADGLARVLERDEQFADERDRRLRGGA